MTELRPTMRRSDPRGMDKTKLPRETSQFIEQEVLDIFATMTNGGCTLQQTLTAIFLSGMSLAHGIKE